MFVDVATVPIIGSAGAKILRRTSRHSQPKTGMTLLPTQRRMPRLTAPLECEGEYSISSEQWQMKAAVTCPAYRADRYGLWDCSRSRSRGSGRENRVGRAMPDESSPASGGARPTRQMLAPQAELRQPCAHNTSTARDVLPGTRSLQDRFMNRVLLSHPPSCKMPEPCH